MFIAVANKSSLVSDNDAQAMTDAIQKQLLLHFCPAWNLQPVKIKFYADATKAPGYAWVITLIDDDSQVPGALGYHTEADDKVVGYVMAKPVLDNGGVVLYDSSNPQNVSVASVCAHEALETVGDRFVNGWCDGPQIKQGYQYALEVCDPVQSNSYVININGADVSVSDFIYPSWFNQEATMKFNAPFNYTKSLTKPFTLAPGGYMSIRDDRGNINQVFDEKVPEWKKTQKKHHGRRQR